MQEIKIKLGKRIKEIREQKNLSQEELGLICGFSGSYMGMIERAECDFKSSKLIAIALALKVNMNELFNFGLEEYYNYFDKN